MVVAAMDKQAFYGAPLRLRAVGRNVSGFLVNYSDIGITSEGKERIEPDAFAPLTGPYHLTLNHAQDKIITNNLQIRSVSDGLEISTQLPDTDIGNEAIEGIRNGKYNGFSAEFYDRDIATDGDIRLVKSGILIGAGIVHTPAFAQSKLQLRSGQRRRVNAWLL